MEVGIDVFLLLVREEGRVYCNFGKVGFGVRGRAGRGLFLCLMCGGVERAVIFLFNGAVGLILLTEGLLLRRAHFFPLIDDLDDDIRLSHGGVLVAVLVVSLP